MSRRGTEEGLGDERAKVEVRRLADVILNLERFDFSTISGKYETEVGQKIIH